MRQKLSLRGWRGRREKRAAPSPQAQERRQRRVLVLVSMLLALALWAILAVPTPSNPGLQSGLPSPIDIRAHRAISYESKLLTEQDRIRAESSPDNAVYTSDPAIPIQQRGQLADLLDTITQIRNDPGATMTVKRDKLEQLPLPNSTLVLSSAMAATIIRLTDEEWATVRQQSLNLYDRAMGEHEYELSDQDIARLRERSLPYWSSVIGARHQQELVRMFSSSFLKPNRLLDEEATRRRKEQARNSVAPVLVQIQQGEIIVRAGEIITPDIQEELEALGELRIDTDWLNIGGKGLLAALIAALFGIYLGHAQRDVWMMSRPLLVVAGLFAFTVLGARVVMPLDANWQYAFPLGMTALLLATLFNSGLALMATTLLSVLIAILGAGEAALSTVLLFGGMAGIFAIGRGHRSLTFVAAGLAITVVTALTQAVFWLTSFSGPTPGQWLPILVFSSVNGALSAILALGLYNLVGHLADVVTPIQLMELSHPAHPLLRKLIREAPGTYYHSVSVGNLAESAAEAIGADALLLRVASYYHDIGKTLRPYFFTDNQSNRENVHNEIDPRTSAEIIADHVREGMKMARAAGLPRQIVEFIPAHHGTSVIKHFYQIALQQEDAVDVEDYRYPGPRPRTREQAIMMLADSVEATVRSKAQAGKIITSREDRADGNGRGQNGGHTIEELVNMIVDERVRSGQLDESPLMLRDIARIKEAFINTLRGIYHPRVDYAPQVVKPS